ncbi:hypothetical protein DSO57_1024911 [Entomophthora muscae]|uniref:Uncharacterized protein n=1 Tax=Entomophthora muscae TaxID=34485 RepID=A0ACC2U0V9_9FUNG|nr:hypothetical protein DSO57_1024911 [Entomophthora muscae]
MLLLSGIVLLAVAAEVLPNNLPQAQLPAGEEKRFELGGKVQMIAKPDQDSPGTWQVRKIVKKPVNGSQLAVSTCYPCPATHQVPCFIQNVHQVSIRSHYSFATKLPREIRLILTKAPETDFLMTRKQNRTQLSKFPISPGTSKKLTFIPKLESFTARLRVKRRDHLTIYFLHERYLFTTPRKIHKSAPGYFELAPC